jgi:hypothetical protein
MYLDERRNLPCLVPATELPTHKVGELAHLAIAVIYILSSQTLCTARGSYN